MNLTIPERWTSFTLDDGRGGILVVQLTTNPLARFACGTTGPGWYAAGSGVTAQAALDEAVAEIAEHSDSATPKATPAF